MNAPLHFFQLRPAPERRNHATIEVPIRREPARGAVLFLAPALPTPQQFSSELPFTVNLRSHARQRP